MQIITQTFYDQTFPAIRIPLLARYARSIGTNGPVSIIKLTKSLLLFLLAAQITITQAVSQPAWDNKLDFDEIEHRLLTEPIVSKQNMRSFLQKIGKQARFLHPVKLVTLKSGLKAVMKKEGAIYGEVGAYKASKALGLRLVPPTVIRENNGKKFSLQFYVDSPIDLVRTGHGYFKKLDPKDASDMHIFNFLLNRWDGHTGNQLMSYHKGRYYLALIDNAGSTFLSHKPHLTTKKIYGSTYLALKKLTQAKLEDAWSDYLPVRKSRAREVIQRILKRKEQLMRVVESKGRIVKDRTILEDANETVEIDHDVVADD